MFAFIENFLAFFAYVIESLVSCYFFSYFHVHVCRGYAYVCAHSFRYVWRTVCVWVITHMCMPACRGPMSQSSSTTLNPYSWWIGPQSNPEPSDQGSQPALFIPSLSSAVITNHLSVLSIWTPTISLPCEANSLTTDLSALLSLLPSYVPVFWKPSLLLSPCKLCCHVQTLTVLTWLLWYPLTCLHDFINILFGRPSPLLSP